MCRLKCHNCNFVTQVRDGLFELFIDVRTGLKARMPREMLRCMAQYLYNNWVKQQSPPIPKEKQLQFTDKWLAGWVKEYEVSLKSPNKRFSISFKDLVRRLVQHLKNVLRFRIYQFKMFGVENPPIINGDQMPLHRNECRQVQHN